MKQIVLVKYVIEAMKDIATNVAVEPNEISAIGKNKEKKSMEIVYGSGNYPKLAEEGVFIPIYKAKAICNAKIIDHWQQEDLTSRGKSTNKAIRFSYKSQTKAQFYNPCCSKL